MKIETVAERLKNLRVNAGYSHERLATALQEKYKTSITSASLKKYEVSDPYHSNYGAVKGMRIEYLDMFADFYGVSSDYILGRTNSISLDLNNQVICDTFGLSFMAVTNFKILHNVDKKLIEEKYFGINPTILFEGMLRNFDFLMKFTMFLFKYYVEKEKYLQHPFNYRLEDYTQYVGMKKTFVDENKYYAMCQFEAFIDSFYDLFLKIKRAGKNYNLDEMILETKKTIRKRKENGKEDK